MKMHPTTSSPAAHEEDHGEHDYDNECEDKGQDDDEGGDDDDEDEADVIIHGLGAELRIYTGYYPLQWPPREQGVGRGQGGHDDDDDVEVGH